MKDWAARLHNFRREAHDIFSVVESAPSRKLTLDESYATLQSLSLKQDDLFRQSLRCVEHDLFRAAHVMAWAAFVDCLHGLAASDSFFLLGQVRPVWKVSTIDDLAEKQTEHAFIQALYEMKVVNKAGMKALHGMLSKRNECAHPTGYFPGLNETLGYISELFQRLIGIERKYPLLQIA